MKAVQSKGVSKEEAKTMLDRFVFEARALTILHSS